MYNIRCVQYEQFKENEAVKSLPIFKFRLAHSSVTELGG